jgi:molybdate transport system substrate-binding protein
MRAPGLRARAFVVVVVVVVLALLGSLVAGCGAGESGGEADARSVVHVAAAASLADVLPPLAAELEAEQRLEIVLRFGASSMLARQILDGAPIDVFVSAEPRWIDELAAAGLVDAAERAVIATNRLVAIVPASASDVPPDVHALASLPHLALAAPEVPAGAHARTALSRAGVLDLALPRLVEAPDVRAALGWVALGEAEGGIVFATDARVEPRVRVAFVLPAESHDPIRYEACAIAPSGDRPTERVMAARAVVAMLRSAASADALRAAGFGPPT